MQRTHSSIAVAPLSLDFGPLEAGQSATLSFTVSNTGSTALHVGRAFLRGDARTAFSAEELPDQIAAGDSVAVSVTYRAPDAEGADGAQWVVESDADNAPEYIVPLSGRSAARCLLGLTWCDETCVDTASDDAHCGDCETSCEAPEQCLQGVCGCEPRSCATLECGDGDDGCGGPLSCGECASPQVCLERRCVAPTCTDHVQDGDETDVDCGGSCSPCPLGRGCATGADCSPGLVCIDGVCSNCRTTEDCPSDQVCKDGLCGACATREECGDGRACIAGRCRSCPEEAAFNECGLCGGTPVSGLGINCLDSSTCLSQYVCNAQLVGLVCAPVGRNECGACGGVPVTGIGDSCTNANGCASLLACAADQVSTVCTPVAKDECGVCGGTTVGINTFCTDLTSECPSTWACDATSGRVCTPVHKDECGVCGGTATGIGTECTDPVSGCESTWACDASGGRVCTPVAKNACDVCGGAPVVNAPDAPCTGDSGCAGTWECSGADTVCNAPASCSWANHLVISQICGEGPTLNDDYVEIYNPTSSPIAVSDHKIFYRNTANVTDWTNQIPLEGTVPAHGWLLVAHTAGMYAATADVKSNNTNFGAFGGQMMLWKGAAMPPALPTKSDAGYVDLVGYGTAAHREGTAAAPAPGTGGAIVRKANPASTPTSMTTGGADASSGNGSDTDDNAADFVTVTELVPRTTSSTPRP